MAVAYSMLLRYASYRKPGPPPVDEYQKALALDRMLKHIEQREYNVHRESSGEPAS